MSDSLTEFEAAVMQMIVAGDHPAFEALRDQLASCRVSQRRFTGVGFFADLAVDRSAKRVPEPAHNARVSDVVGDVAGLKHGAGFVLFVSEGYMTVLEGFSYDEPWPEHIKGYELGYMSGTRDLSKFGI
jgi:hypothetical protein